MIANEWFEISQNIKIERFGYRSATIPHPSRKGIPYWVLVLVQTGKRTLYVNGEELRIGAGEFFLLPPNTEQMPLEIDEHTAYYAHFYAHGKSIPCPSNVDASRLRLPMYGYLPPDIDCLAYVRYLYEHATGPHASNQFLTAQLCAMISILSLQCQKNPHPTKKCTCADANAYLAFIKENAHRALYSPDYEQTFGLSYHQINLVFKRQFGQTVKQYHTRIRMELAARMLISGKNIQETAKICGFDDYFFFIRCFTKAHGISPDAYRKRHGGQEITVK